MSRASYAGLWILWVALILSGALMVGGDFWRDILSGPSFASAPQFPHEGLFVAPVGLDDIEGYVAAFGDFNADTYVDAFVVTDNDTVCRVYLWSHEQWQFRELESARLFAPHITAVLPADFDGDGRLDVLIQGQVDVTELYTRIILGKITTFDTSSIRELPHSQGPLAILDHNGDLLPDLFGSPVGIAPTQTEKANRAVWLNLGAANFSLLSLPPSSLPLSPHHAHSLVDLDGDCRADHVVIACNQTSKEGERCESLIAEIWVNSANGFSLRHSVALPTGTQHVSFSDLNGDGAADMVYIVCAPPFSSECHGPQLQILFNEQLPLCQGLVTLTSPNCKPLSALCTADPAFRFASVAVKGNMNGTLRASPQTGLVRVRLGDLDLDGFPDIALVAGDDSSSSSPVQLWLNKEKKECNGPCAPFLAISSSRRLELQTKAHMQSAMKELGTVRDVAFFDLDETGALDLLVLRSLPSGALSVTSVFNNLFSDAFFLKVLGLNGVCVSDCPTGQRYRRPKPFGVNAHGPTFTFTVTQMNGQRRLAHGTQLSQASHLALETPYQLFGLGRTNNYIEMIYLGVSLRSGVHFNSWTPVIPNTQLVAIPYPPSNPLLWTLESYLSPSDVTLWVAVAVLSALVANAAVIWFFRWREQVEDEREKKASAHLFSFEAMG